MSAICEASKACLEKNAPLLIFAGAGISKDSGLPLWEEAAKEAIRLAITRQPSLSRFFEQIPLDDLPFAFECIKRKLTRPMYEALLGQVFKRSAKPCEYHRLIVSTSALGIITTNFDQLLEDAFAEIHRIMPPRFLNAEQDLKQLMRETAGFIFKMHGDISRPSELICATSEYEQFYSSVTLQNLLIRFASSSQFLFVGFSFTDHDFKSLWERVSQLSFPKGPPILVGREQSLSLDLKQEIKKLGIHLIGYSSPDVDYTPCLEVLRCIAAERPLTGKHPVVEVTLPSDPYLLKQVLSLLLGLYEERSGKSSSVWLLSSVIIHDLMQLPNGIAIKRSELVGKALAHLGTHSNKWEGDVASAIAILESTEVVESDAADGLQLTGKARIAFGKKRENSEKDISYLLKRTWERAKSKDPGISDFSPDLAAMLRDSLSIFIQSNGKLLAESMLFISLGPTEHQIVERAIGTIPVADMFKTTVHAVFRELAFSPDQSDESTLFELIQTGFLVSAYVLNPAAEDYLRQETAKYSVFFDAHVILKALALGNPCFDSCRRLIQKTISLGMEALVIEDFIEEVFSHYGLAMEELNVFTKHGVSNEDAAEAYCMATGERKANAFLIGFRNSIRSGIVTDWKSYTRHIFELENDSEPMTEATIKEVITRKLGVRGNPKVPLREQGVDLDRITESISQFRKMDGTFRNMRVCKHDAYQLALIYHRREHEPGKADKIWCVTNDAVMYRFYANSDRSKYPLPPTYTPMKWAQYLDLLEYEPRSSRHYGRLFAVAQAGIIDDLAAKQLLRDALEKEHDIFKRGIASIKDFVAKLIESYHVRRAADEYRIAVGKGDAAEQAKAKRELQKQVENVLNEYVELKKNDYHNLKEARDSALKQKQIVDKEFARLKHKSSDQKKTIEYLNERIGKARKRRKPKRR